jgi:hypothetical protein
VAAAVKARSARAKVNTDSKPVHVVLIGASIGQGWHLEAWPVRMNEPGFRAEAVAAWQFDKTEALDEVLMRPSRKFRPTRTYFKSLFQPRPSKPDILILKECSSYFPGGLEGYKASIQRWTKRAQADNVKVVLATVVPVTKARSAQVPGKQQQLLEYNRWIRQYAREQGLSVLDLEAALRENSGGAYLRDEYNSGDGTHLNASAYAVLDGTLRTLLCGTISAQSCNSRAEAKTAAK